MVHILANIARSEGNQKMSFGQLTEYYVRDMFLGNSYTKCDRETFPRPFPKKSK